MSCKTRFGIIGCGSAAVPVCEAVADSKVASLALAQDVDGVLAQELGERYEIPYTTELDEVLKADLDAVYIAVPHHLLAEITRQALNAGKHVLVEKPMALSVEEADELIALAVDKNLTLGVFYEMRYADGFRQVREMVRESALGAIVGVRMQTLIDKPLSYWERGYGGRSANPWRGDKAQAGGGVLLMNTSHLFDALGYVTGLQVTRVTAEIATRVASVQVEDSVAATFTLDNGAVGSLFAGAHVIGAGSGDEFFDLYGTRGTVRVPDPYSTNPLQLFLREPWRDWKAGVWHILPVAAMNVFAQAIDEFACAAQLHAPAPIDGHAARRVLQIVLGMYRAAEHGRAVTIKE